MAPPSFELLHVSGQIILEKFEPIANVAAKLFWKFAELSACFFGDEEFVSHWAEVYQ